MPHDIFPLEFILNFPSLHLKVPFFEWFFKLAEMVNKHFLQMWNDGYAILGICGGGKMQNAIIDIVRFILGFCGKEEAELLLSQCPRPTLLVRFSDIEFAKVKISVRDQYGGNRTIKMG
jgi:hypothetical protein